MLTSATRLRNSEVLVLFRRSRASLCWTTGCSMTWTSRVMPFPPSRPRFTGASPALSGAGRPPPVPGGDVGGAAGGGLGGAPERVGGLSGALGESLGPLVAAFRDRRPHPLAAGALFPVDPAARVRALHRESPREPQAAHLARALPGLLHQRAHHPAHALADAGGDSPRLCPDRARQRPRRARGDLPPRPQERAPPRGHLRGLVGWPPAGWARDHGDHLRRARHGDLAGAGRLATRLSHRPGVHLRDGGGVPPGQPGGGSPPPVARPPPPVRLMARALGGFVIRQ